MTLKSIVVKDRRVVLVRHPDLEQIACVIPTAKCGKLRGVEIAAVTHGVDETRVLNNLGFNIPSPIKYYYKWSGKYTPFHAQLETAAKLTLNPRMYVLNDLGTGKTMAACWAFDYLRLQRKAHKMLVLSPLSTLERVWADEIKQHFPHLTVKVLHGTADKRVKLLAEYADVYIMNHDGVKVDALLVAILKRNDIDVVVIDELAEFKKANTVRYKRVAKIVATRQYVWGMTGTPIPNTPADAWAQCHLVTPGTVPKYFTAFRTLVERKLTEYKWTPLPGALDVVLNAMRPHVRFRRDECLDLPETMYERRQVEMTDAQVKAYNTMMKDLVIEHAQGKIVALNQGILMSKLLQVATGCMYTQDGTHVEIDCKTRLEVCKELIDAAAAKVIVYVPLMGGLNIVAKYLSQFYDVRMVHGEVTKNQRDEIFAEFMSPTGNVDVLVAHPKCMNHGLTLTAANVIIWFIPTVDHNVFVQANGRIARPGQKLTTHIYMLEGSRIEQMIYKRLQNKSSTQDALLELIKNSFDAEN